MGYVPVDSRLRLRIGIVQVAIALVVVAGCKKYPVTPEEKSLYQYERSPAQKKPEPPAESRELSAGPNRAGEVSVPNAPLAITSSVPTAGQPAIAAPRPAPLPPALASTKKVTRRGITWTFDKSYKAGTFANGDVWVVGPVKIVAIDPPSVERSGRIVNGSEVNPKAGVKQQGFDSSMQRISYVPELNVAFGISAKKPLRLVPGSSLVSSISAKKKAALPQLDQAEVLTVVGTSPRKGSFRPPYVAGDKTIRHRLSDLRVTDLPRLKCPRSVRPNLETLLKRIGRPWLDHHRGWSARYAHPAKNMPDYGRDICRVVSSASLFLMTDAPRVEKQALMIRYVQHG
ncbi:MAG: hypothetical protein AAF517_23305, partial [Planctomycetota bacterium]